MNTIAKFEAEKLALEQQLESKPDTKETIGAESSDTDLSQSEDADLHPICGTFHLVFHKEGKQYFRDVTQKFRGNLLADQLRGRHEIENITKYLESHSRTAFAIMHEYSGEEYISRRCHHSVGYKGGKLIQDAPPPEPDGQYIKFGP